MAVNAPNQVRQDRERVCPGPVDQRQALVLRNLRADAGVQAHGADAQAVPVPDLDQIQRRFAGVQQVFQLPEGIRIGEILDEIVSGAAGIVGQRHVRRAGRAADGFVEGPVAAAGIDAGLLPALGGLAGECGDVSGLFGDPDPVIQTPGGAKRIDLRGESRRAVAFPGGRVDQKQMRHALRSPL